ncbi:MAG: hypothetical protein E7359_02290 [Clostridiales bacterium]|nr:hypothetical protein [Clostridiales bacterium]
MFNILKKHKDLVIILSLLVLFVVFAIFVSSTLTFFKNNSSVKGEVQLGELDFTINVTNFTNKNYMPGDEIDINVNIENKVENKEFLIPFYFRFSFIDEFNYLKTFLKANLEENFIYDNKEYYYYKYKVNVNDKVKLINGIRIDKNFTDQTIKEIDISVIIDAVQSEYGAYKEIFYDAPTEWIEFIENN